MKINNIETEDMDIELLTREIGVPEITTQAEWLDGRLEPHIEEQFFKFKPIELEMLLEKFNDNDAEKEISKLVALAGKCSIEFDDLDFKYVGYLTDVGRNKITIGRYDLTLSFMVAYGMASRVTQSITTSGSVVLDSSMTTPVQVIVTSTTARGSITINGLGHKIVLNNVKTNVPVVIDGETGLITESNMNNFKNYESWGFPRLEVGTNLITVDSGVKLELAFNPRWL